MNDSCSSCRRDTGTSGHSCRAKRFFSAKVFADGVARNAFGIPGTGSVLVDRDTGSYTITYRAGPIGETTGFDGKTAWREDASGAVRIQGNSERRAAIIIWSRLIANAGPTPYANFSVGAGELLDEAVLHTNADEEKVRLQDYRTDRGFRLPHDITVSSNGNVWHAFVVSVRGLKTIQRYAFSAPTALPKDFSLEGTSTIRLLSKSGPPIIEVRVNDEPMRFVLDTGANNLLTESAAADCM